MKSWYNEIITFYLNHHFAVYDKSASASKMHKRLMGTNTHKSSLRDLSRFVSRKTVCDVNLKSNEWHMKHSDFKYDV